MSRRVLFAVLVVTLLSLTALVSAQEIMPREGQEIDPSANISWPPPVYVLRGQIDIYGSASLPNMTNYFIEFRPLDTSEVADEDEDEPAVESPWFPVTLPSSQPVTEDVLGRWNTATAPDGLYEMRLAINVSGSPAVYFLVSPLRIENDPPEFVVDPVAPPTATFAPVTRPTLAASPTPLDTEPRATANVNANIRSGDSVLYPRLDSLRANQTVPIRGISATGSGWYYIELPDGRRGWVAPSVVTAAGNLGTLPRINPPPPPVTPTPIPSPTPTAVGNLTGSPPALTPNPPICNQQFQVLANITNTGTARTNASASVLIQDIHVASGQVQASATRAIPQLDPGENFVVGADFTISTFYNEEHRIIVTIDINNEVIETTKADNVLTTTYILQQGTCP
jgi:uncharacterized protein YgiM (DUF1202 family)